MTLKPLPATAALLAALLLSGPAAAQTTDAITTLFTEWQTWLVTVLAVFAVLVGLIVAWIIAWRNLLAGAVVAVSVLALGAMVGNYATIAGALGLG